jgi:hypothetical protein
MPQLLPAIPDAEMHYKVETVFYGHSPADRIGVRPILIETFACWARDVVGALDEVRTLLTTKQLELIKFTAADVEKGVIRQRIINDPEYSADASGFMRKE